MGTWFEDLVFYAREKKSVEFVASRQKEEAFSCEKASWGTSKSRGGLL